MEIQAGTYDARVVDYGVTSSKAGVPGVYVKFEFEDMDGIRKALSWYGYFKNEKNSEITCNSLAILGWSTNDPSDLAQGPGSGVLDEENEVSIVIEPNTYEGVTRMQVKYINQIGGAVVRMEKAEAKKLFNGMNLSGLAAAARKKYGTAAKTVPNMAPKFEQDEEIPF